MDREIVMEDMNRAETGVPRGFMLRQIENEIQAGFALIAAARKALQLSDAEVHQQAAGQPTDSETAQVRSVIQQVTELREAIDLLLEK